MEKYNKVIVIGAGFSKGLCKKMPVIKDLLDGIEKGSKLDNFINKIKEELNDYYDVESCVSYILSREIFFNDKENIDFYALRKELLRHIYDKIKSYEPDEKYMNIMKKFLYYCSDENVLLVTFNYDLFIERICEYLNENKNDAYDGDIKVRYGIRLEDSPYQEGKIIDGGNFSDKHIQLLKIHGSLNWFNMIDNESANINDIIVANDEEIDVFFKENTPFYVPMSNTKYKYFAGNLFEILWKKMNNYIDDADELNFIGYSFPKIDFDNVILFNKYKEKVKNIVIYNTDEDIKNKERLEKIFTKAEIHTDGAIEYINRLVSK